MNTVFLASFARDLRKVRDDAVLEQVRAAILQIEEASDTRSIPHLKKLAGGGSLKTPAAAPPQRVAVTRAQRSPS